MSIEELITIVLFSFICITYSIGVLIATRICLIHNYYDRARKLIQRSARNISKQYATIDGDELVICNLLNKYPNPNNMIWSLHKWTFKQFYGGLEKDLDEIESVLIHKNLLYQLESREAKK